MEKTPPASTICEILRAEKFFRKFNILSVTDEVIFVRRMHTTKMTPITPKRKRRAFSAPYFKCSGSVSERNKITMYRKIKVVRNHSAVSNSGTRDFW